MREKAVGLMRASDQRVRFVVGDACAIPEPDRSFDAVRCERMLQWLADPTLQIVETRAKDSAGGASFTLFATQRRQASAEDDDPVETPTGKAKKKAAAK